ncbi:hypothetical protein LVY72_02980 [Arthrobacter sp. I2-34]|uniref:Uncharacterized protein n=1 Tax=Arthrobacter hankyongi TaxID=2904801 RepID=A0ABS9L2K6_9MICC|nr:hypothetical protein [Arthrobacter hankyongi]MCG2620875.1 hypothetical protein [Arthrobacter hankyongi]
MAILAIAFLLMGLGFVLACVLFNCVRSLANYQPGIRDRPVPRRIEELRIEESRARKSPAPSTGAKAKKQHRIDEHGQWDEDYTSALRPSDRPDYVEPSVHDRKVSSIIDRSPDGRRRAKVSHYQRPDGCVYTIRKDYHPLGYRIYCGRYTEDITDKWLKLKEERRLDRKNRP